MVLKEYIKKKKVQMDMVKNYLKANSSTQKTLL